MKRPAMYLPALILIIAASAAQSEAARAQRVEGMAGNSPAAERAAELFQVANAGDRAVVEAYIDRAYAPEFLQSVPREAHLNFLAQLHDGTGGLQVHSVGVSSPGEAAVMYRAPLTGDWRELRLQIEAEAPHRIVRLQPPRPAPPPADQPSAPRRLTAAEAVAELDEYARRLSAADVFSGAVLIARGDTVIFHSTYGAASREHNVPNTTATRFIIGSINKMFTTVGILQLVEQGRLSLSDPVAAHLPGVLPDDIGGMVRIEHLLTHTSGLGDFLFVPAMMERSRPSFRTIDDYLPQLAGTRLRFEPGAGWFYSNTGFLLLGAIIERVTGQPYDDYVAAHVLTPAGMVATGAPDLDLVPAGLASTYQREFADGRPRFRSDRYVQPVRGTPAGGGFSTAEDLHRFIVALRNHRLLSPEMTRLMLTPKPALGSGQYGFGAQMFTPDASRFGHTGGGPGTSAIVDMDVENDLLVVILGNQNTGSGSVLRRARQLFGAGPPTQSW